MAITGTITCFHTIAGQVEEISHNMAEIFSQTEKEAAALQEFTARVSEVKIISGETAQEAVGSLAEIEETSVVLYQVSTVISDHALVAPRINESVSLFNG